MKFTFFAAALSLAMLVGCSHVQDSKRIPASVKDVGVIGPNGDVLLYYKDGDYIIVKNCELNKFSNDFLGNTSVSAQKNCHGKSNRVPVESFKQAIRHLVSTDRLNVLKPLTPEEIDAYIKDGFSSEQIATMEIELDKINAFITRYGAENANLVLKEDLVKALRSPQARVSAIKKINVEIENALNLIMDQTKLTVTKFNSEKDTFLYTVLKSYDPTDVSPCGLKGSVDERIRDCSRQLTAEKEGFVLVVRSQDFYEVYKENSTGLLWSDRLESRMNRPYAGTFCTLNPKELAGIKADWRLPSKDEYEEAEKSGIRKALPRMGYWFWASSWYTHRANRVYGFNGADGAIEYADTFSAQSVRCVAR